MGFWHKRAANEPTCWSLFSSWAPMGSKGGPKGVQGGARGAQKGSRGNQGGPKRGEGEPKRDPGGAQGDQKGVLGDLFRARWRGGRRQLYIYIYITAPLRG